MKINAYWKGVIGALTPVLVIVQTATDDGRVDVGEGLAIAGALLIAFGVWRVPNKTP